MSNQIVEYIGANKLVHSKQHEIYARMKTPHAGDVVDFGEDYKNNPYPYNCSRYGRIDSDNSVFCEKEGDYQVCFELGSCFLGWSEDKQKSYVSISGGPFEVINIKNLLSAERTMPVNFWNWGNNYIGAGQGVDYSIYRPVFEWIP